MPPPVHTVFNHTSIPHHCVTDSKSGRDPFFKQRPPEFQVGCLLMNLSHSLFLPSPITPSYTCSFVPDPNSGRDSLLDQGPWLLSELYVDQLSLDLFHSLSVSDTAEILPFLLAIMSQAPTKVEIPCLTRGHNNHQKFSSQIVQRTPAQPQTAEARRWERTQKPRKKTPVYQRQAQK